MRSRIGLGSMDIEHRHETETAPRKPGLLIDFEQTHREERLCCDGTSLTIVTNWQAGRKK
jgi:hypothetical protein